MRNDEDAGALLASIEAVSEVIGHGTAILREKNTVLLGSDIQHLGIAQPDYPAIRRGREARVALPSANRHHDVVIEVSVGLEADQGCGTRVLVRARLQTFPKGRIRF